jgi:hypothetical protein
MCEKTEKKTSLKLIRGGLECATSFGSVRIVAASEQAPPFTVDAVALEEDTFLIMSAKREVRDPKHDLMRIMTRLIETRPKEPGSVLVKGRRPFKFLAIVHDVNQDPTLREEWVESALEGILQETETRKLRSVALPLIGTLHGPLEQERFIELLSRAFKRTSLSQLKRLWLMVRPGTARHIIEMLEFELQK